MGEPKAYSELTSELTWHAMSQIVDGTPLKRVISEIMDATIEWHRANRIGKKEPETATGTHMRALQERIEELAKKLKDADYDYELADEQCKNLQEANNNLRQERDTLAAALTASEGDVERLKDENRQLAAQLDRLDDLLNTNVEIERHLRQKVESLVAENKRLADSSTSMQRANIDKSNEINRLQAEKEELEHRLGEVAAERDALAQKNTDAGYEIQGLRQAPEVIKREMNALVQEVSQQRDAAKAACGTNAALLERTRKDFAQAIQQRDQARAEWQAAQRLVKELEEKLATEKLHGDLAVAQKDELEQKNKELLKERDEAKADADGIKKFNDELHEENNLLRHEIEGLKQAPEEVLKSGINALVREISRQRDAEKLRGDVAVAQRDEWIEKHNTCKGALENNERVLNDIIRQRDQARADWQASQRLVKELEDGHNAKNEIIKKLQSNLDYVKLHVHNMNQVLK